MCINAFSLFLKVSTFSSHTLYDPAVILATNDNKPVLAAKVFKNIVPKLGPPPKPIGRSVERGREQSCIPLSLSLSLSLSAVVPEPDSDLLASRLYREEDLEVGQYR